MLAGKTLTSFTNLFSPNNFLIKWCYDFKLFYDSCLKMVECISIESHNIYPRLNDPQLFRLNKINEIKDYFIAEIKKTKTNKQKT